jgi:CheY-like chemotaxis protein
VWLLYLGNWLLPIKFKAKLSNISGPPMQSIFLSSESFKNLAKAVIEGDGQSVVGSPSPRVLVVDDEALIADTIVQILNRNGFIAEAAYGGKDAIEAARRITPELILSDVLMPVIDGVEAAIQIRGFLPETRIVLFSGQAATAKILARARTRGHDFELLAKPIHPTQLIKHLRNA